MAPPTTPDPDEWDQVRRAGEGDARCLDELFARYGPRLARMVQLRLDPRLHGRVDPSQVIRQTYLDTRRKLADYLRRPDLPFFLWLRQLAGQKLELAHREHLGAGAGREVSLYRGALPEPSPAALAARLLGLAAAPGEAAARAGLRIRIQEALNDMDALDREVLTLRHLERLSNAETALVLGLNESAARNRHVRALERLRGTLSGTPGGVQA
jgi:RNA polymerase sigma-70 factor (ECF subfamily)